MSDTSIHLPIHTHHAARTTYLERFWRVSPADCLVCGEAFNPSTAHNGAERGASDRRYCSIKCRNKAARIATRARQQERQAA